MLYYQRGAFSGLELYASHEVMNQNTHNSHFQRHHFVHSFGHILQSIGCTLTLNIANDLLRCCLLTIVLDASFDWQTLSQNTHRQSFLVQLLGIHVTYELEGIY